MIQPDLPDAIDRRPSAGDSWLTIILQAAHDLEESLTIPERMSLVVGQLAEVAATTGAQMITGASPLGHQLAGLVAGAARTHPLALWAQNGAHGTMLIVEGVLASGAQLAATARRARAAGADRVVGVAVVAEPSGLATCEREIGDKVVSLQPLSIAT